LEGKSMTEYLPLLAIPLMFAILAIAYRIQPKG
jgi:hypothetical protein